MYVCYKRDFREATANCTYLVCLVLVHVVPCHQLLHNPQPPMGTSQQEAVQVILQTLGR